jgi:hypothetical protein
LYFVQEISTYTYNEIKRLFLAEDENDFDELNK